MADAWELTPIELDVLTLLEYMLEHEHGDNPADLGGFHPRDPDIWPQVLSTASGYQYVDIHRGVRIVPPMLTLRGRAWVEEVGALRADRAARSKACRTELLRWLYRTPGPQEQPARQFRAALPPKHFYGEPFTDDDVVAALEYLSERGLVARDGVDTASLTGDGVDCVESYGADAAAFPRGPSVSYHGKVIMGDNFENIAGSTIVNRSTVTDSLNKVDNPEVRAALGQILTEVEKLHDANASALAAALTKAVADKESRSVIASLWSSLRKAAPTVSALVAAVEVISKIAGG